ncbi:MAG: pyroglutamyl-peptidase I [Treponema sp.]|nr:MAG: pyroglutamyl-peptidase I [Treponema sp.]
MKILVTGFDPFGEDKVNPALETIKNLPAVINGHDVFTLEIPTVGFKSLEVIKEGIKKYDPDIVLSIGQAAGRFDITVERVGINLDDYRIADNEGNQFIDSKIFKEAPDAYIVKLPVKKMVENIKAHGIPASVSMSAGTFVCNHVLFGVSHILATKFRDKKNGFIHIPCLPEQAVDKRNMPSMSKETILQGIIHAIEVIAEDEITVTGGKIC